MTTPRGYHRIDIDDEAKRREVAAMPSSVKVPMTMAVFDLPTATAEGAHIDI